MGDAAKKLPSLVNLDLGFEKAGFNAIMASRLPVYIKITA